MSLYDGSYLPDSDRKAFPTGHAVLHFVILRPLSGQRLRLLNLHHHQTNNTIIKEQQSCKICQHFCQSFGLHILCFSFSLNLLRFTTDLEWLVLSAELLHGCCGVFQFPPHFYHFGLQFLDFTFTLYTPEHNQRTLRNACSNSIQPKSFGPKYPEIGTPTLLSLSNMTWTQPSQGHPLIYSGHRTTLPGRGEKFQQLQDSTEPCEPGLWGPRNPSARAPSRPNPNLQAHWGSLPDSSSIPSRTLLRLGIINTVDYTKYGKKRRSPF